MVFEEIPLFQGKETDSFTPFCHYLAGIDPRFCIDQDRIEAVLGLVFCLEPVFWLGRLTPSPPW